ncbi:MULTISPECIES: response regulator [Vibrio]|uniref:response regulator n=1 Tax=Vibrio TaxID=662 RepID=UPI002075C7F1|nr:MULTISPECIES: response regulator transcription factor [Vibrio]USD34683.1 response regulator transcription factor [Vibrio sp. SCSIO 43186]USD47750.1 response regulator transcription factor [Vibrio sp. SCSIO 43145]USD71808.1 response regulator transcription factor [Vibrio sp. SCSIO 43139]USD98709.1 DNA-binding response regulator [Vibrio coralliilyticus]
MKILLIEDDTHIARFLINGFQQEGCTITHATNGVDGLHEAISEYYDVIVLDIMLPQKDGFEVLAQLRGEGHVTPVLILSAKHSVDERVKGLQSGADDYLVKPFAFPELLARCQSLARRGQQNPAQSYQLSYSELSLDLLKHSLERNGASIQLNQREFMLIKLMLENPETVISKTAILEQVWGHQFDPQTNVVDVLVCRLRSKVDKGFDTPLIHTLRGVGYVLKSQH